MFVPHDFIPATLDLLRYKKNVVLQGPPGVGKTFLAQRLAYLLLGSRDRERLSTVQFHQSYAYEDFVQGYRPTATGGFERRDGPFLRFCDRALQDDDSTPYVMIIDEINRGNLSKVFGELLLLLEPDKRAPRWATELAYSYEDEEPFYVPPNLYVIGTMNTADRSLALVDYALRRRFAFVDVSPALHSPVFKEHMMRLGVSQELSSDIRERVAALNKLIREDGDLGAGFQIGHSYFCASPGDGPCDDEWYERIVRTEIEPLFREYWFDADDQVEAAVNLLFTDE